MVAPRIRPRTPSVPSSSRFKAQHVIGLCVIAAFTVLFHQTVRISDEYGKEAGNSGTLLPSLKENKSLPGNLDSSATDNNNLDTFPSARTSAGNYMFRHAQILREESDRLELSLEDDLRAAALRGRNAATSTRISQQLHLVLYASPPTLANNNTDVMVELLRLQAERSKFFATITTLGPNDVDDEFRRDFQDILPSSPRIQQTVDYGLWRYPLWEKVMKQIPLYDMVLFLDSSNTAGIYATGGDMLDKWVKRVAEASERRNEPRREFMRFPQDPRKNGDLKWTNDALFDAFGLQIQGDNAWWQATKVQYYGGLMLLRNGAQWRNMTSLIYKTLVNDPYVITDRYSDVTRKRRPTRFGGHRYHQSVSSIATKVLDNHIQSPLMANWASPPFRLSQHQVRNVVITKQLVIQWASECKNAGRDKDRYCDSFFDGNAPNK